MRFCYLGGWISFKLVALRKGKNMNDPLKEWALPAALKSGLFK